MLYLQELLFFRMKVDRNTDYLTVLELATYLLVLDIFLESTNVVWFNIFLGVLAIAGNGNGVEHSHQVCKRLCTSIVWCC